ncbi:ABC transporter substrate-binding protein [Cohnella hashimotonis]|uniref:Extracellular solute-binding protein n=1 Tax=Cohnella hashimotonis TaxID=2826895 RepID=A0ABT6TTD0_9BACL|nr:extracellular solute-binding protein [Cohnella hashimotonis]MDI4649771.1 extracellular solute-binding protein [Cohnella hashimotonis]
MARKWLGIALTGILASSLAACGGSNGGNASPSASSAASGTGAASGSASASPAASQAEPVKLNFWTPDRGATDHIKAEIARYNETNKDNIQVEVNIMAENYDQQLDIAFASNQAPDIVRVNGLPSLSVFVKKGYLAPLDDRLTPDMKERFGSLLREGVNQIGGKTYTLPNYGTTQRLIYNVELFEKAGIKEPPKTLQEMIDVAKKLTAAGKADGAYGIAGNLKSTGSGLRFADPIGMLSGMGSSGYDYKKGAFEFAQLKPIIEAYRQMKVDGSFIPGVEQLDIDPLRAQFAEGKIGMYISTASEPLVYKNQFPAKIKWASALPPTIDGQQQGIVPVGNAGIFIGLSPKSEHKEEAWKFMEWMYSDEVLKSYQEDGVGISVVPSVLAKAGKPEINGIDGFMPTKFDAIIPPVPIVAIEGMGYQEAFIKYILVGGDLDAVIKDLNARYNAALDKAKAAGEVKAEPMSDFNLSQLQGTLAK